MTFQLDLFPIKETESLIVKFLFKHTNQEIYTILQESIQYCEDFYIISGFVTPEGINLLFGNLTSYELSKLKGLVIGKATEMALRALDQLVERGIPQDHLKISLGYSRNTKSTKNSFIYHPMMHSKIYLFKLDYRTFRVFIGSHNLTGFALGGLNAEASVMIEGTIDHEEIQKIIFHVYQIQQNSTLYKNLDKEGLIWWWKKHTDGIKSKINDASSEKPEKIRTLIIIAKKTKHKPKKGDIIYFEMPDFYRKIENIHTEAHIYFFEHLPQTPQDAIQKINHASDNLFCHVVGIESDHGGKELEVQWHIPSIQLPILERAPQPFRPLMNSKITQIRLKSIEKIYQKFEYKFYETSDSWEPVYNEESKVNLPNLNNQDQNLKCSEINEFYKVEQIQRNNKNIPYHEELKHFFPLEKNKNFIFISSKRLKL